MLCSGNRRYFSVFVVFMANVESTFLFVDKLSRIMIYGDKRQLKVKDLKGLAQFINEVDHKIYD